MRTAVHAFKLRVPVKPAALVTLGIRPGIKDPVKVGRSRILACSIILAWNIGQRVGLYSRGTLDSVMKIKQGTC